MKNYYERLGVLKTCEPEILRASYKALSMLYHPDRESGDAKRMTAINEAYETLSDPERRKAYNLMLDLEYEPEPTGSSARDSYDEYMRERASHEPTPEPEKNKSWWDEEMNSWNNVVEASKFLIGRVIIFGVAYLFFKSIYKLWVMYAS